MTPNIASEFIVDANDSRAFARLSGDFNPLHLDAVAARRTQFGGTVVHGIHLILATLDRVAQTGALAGGEVAAISVTFSSPVRTGTPVRFAVSIDPASRRLRLTGEAEKRTAFSATVELSPSDQTPPSRSVESAEWHEEPPRVGDFAEEVTGSVPLKLHTGLLQQLFPGLAKSCEPLVIAELLATTRLVGMIYPGLDSIFSTLTAKRAPSGNVDSVTSYRVSRTDPRFRLVRLLANGPALACTIEAFFRPRPVAQESLAAVATQIASTTFVGQRALVIGGSRGLGELTAKILTAGGAAVTITYALGREDAQRIVAEAAASGLTCDAEQLDVFSNAELLPQWLQERGFTHVYYFASPPIARNPTEQWNHELFERFAHVYVRSFAALATKVSHGASPASRCSFFYPSTVFIERPEKGFAEYCAAKAAGEVFCDYLAQRLGISISRPRLPRMRTDQTNGLSASVGIDPLPVMLEAIRDLHARSQTIQRA